MRVSSLCLALLLPAAAIAAVKPPDLSELSDLYRVPTVYAARVPVVKALRAAAAGKASPLEIGVAVPLSLTLADGFWDSPEPGLSRWRSRLFSSEAKSISFEFSRFELPSDAALWLYDAEGSLLQGPYTAADRNPQGGLWTALVPGDSVVLELRLPTSQRDTVVLQAASINHNYRGLQKAGINSSTAGTCNIDVAAAQGDGFRNEIRSVAAYTVRVGSSNFVCTGQLVNNFRQDSTPYFLTANHCGATASNSSTVVLYWNLQRATCGSGNGSLNQTQSGSVFRASDATADFTLLQLNAAPSASFNVHFAGFDASGNAPQSGAAIHHPQGDVKKISLYSTTSCSTSVSIDDRDTDAWAVRWAQGTTEQGSSGGGLFNQNRRLVGLLSGGDADCSNPGGTDYFGRLVRAWRANNTSSGQLKAWLDPDNSGRVSLCGQNPDTPCDNTVRTTGLSSPGTVSPPPIGSPAAATPPNTSCTGNAPASPSPANLGNNNSCGVFPGGTPSPTPTPTPTPSTSSGGGAPNGLLLLLLGAAAWWRRRMGLA